MSVEQLILETYFPRELIVFLLDPTEQGTRTYLGEANIVRRLGEALTHQPRATRVQILTVLLGVLFGSYGWTSEDLRVEALRILNPMREQLLGEFTEPTLRETIMRSFAKAECDGLYDLI